MSLDMLTHYQGVIEGQIFLQEALLKRQVRAAALLEVLLASDLRHHSTVTLHEFLCELSDMLFQAKTLSEELLNRLLKAITLIEPPKGSSGNTPVH